MYEYSTVHVRVLVYNEYAKAKFSKSFYSNLV